MSEHEEDFMHKVDKSAVITIVGIILLFSSAVIVTLIAPGFIDSTWTEPTSSYQVQMYEVADPHIYISRLQSESSELQSVYHLQRDYSLLAIQEAAIVRIVAPNELKRYITRYKDPTMKLTSRLLMLRPPKPAPRGSAFDGVKASEEMRTDLQEQWEREHPNWQEKGLQKPAFDIVELFEIDGDEAFAIASTDRITENWVDEDYEILDDEVKQPWHDDPGVIYVNNPTEYRVKFSKFGREEGWSYDPAGETLTSIEQLESHPLGFRSRKDLISYGEHIYAIEGCWYCHTDQTRTLVQDVVLNGSEAYPAPPLFR